MKEYKRMQIKCSKCGNVVHKNVIGELTESDRTCEQCGHLITEGTHIAEVKQEFLLE